MVVIVVKKNIWIENWIIYAKIRSKNGVSSNILSLVSPILLILHMLIACNDGLPSNWIFSQKSGFVTFLALSCPNLIQKIRMILWLVIEEKVRQTGHTHVENIRIKLEWYHDWLLRKTTNGRLKRGKITGMDNLL